jgi:hypothetical protein
MYRPELDKLIALFQSSCVNVVISDNQNRYSSLDEMKAHIGLRIKDLDIRGENPGLHFLLNQREFAPGSTTPAVFNELRTEEITEQAEALFFKIREFLLSHQRPDNTRFLISAILGMVGALWLITRNAANTTPPGQHVYAILGIIVCLVFSILCVILGTANARNHLLLETKLNSPTFFARNWEHFAKYAITALISGIIGWIVGHFLK